MANIIKHILTNLVCFLTNCPIFNRTNVTTANVEDVCHDGNEFGSVSLTSKCTLSKLINGLGS